MNDQDKTHDELMKKLQELQQENKTLKEAYNDLMAAGKVTETGLKKNCNEISDILKAEEENEFAENIINTLREPLLILDQDLRVVKASRSFYHFFKVCANETVGQLVYELGNNQWDIPKLRELLETILPEKTTFDDYEVEHDFTAIGKRVMLLNARQIRRVFGKEKIILLAFEDITARKSAEELINEKSRITSEYLDILLNHAHAPIIIWDSSLEIKRFNHEFEKLSGYKSAEVIDQKIGILFPKGKITSTLELLTNHLSNENPQVTEIDILTKDKDIKTVLWNSANIFDKAGKSIVATITQDISSRKRFEDALRNSETLLRTLVHTIPDLIWLKDTNGVYLSCNTMFGRFFGADEADIIGKTDFDFVDKELAGFFRENDRKAMEAGMPTSNEEWVTFADDGHQAYLETIKTPMYDSNGTLLGVIGIGRDITKRKQAEEALIKLNKAIYTSGEAIFLTDRDGVFTFVNPAFTALYGYTSEEIVGKVTPRIIKSGVLEKTTNDVFWQSLLKGNEVRRELKNKRKDGTLIDTEGSSTPIIDDKNNIIGFLGIHRDITERKQSEKESLILAHSLKSVNECVSITDLDNIILFVNESFLKTYGYDINELIGQHISLVYSEDNKNKQEQAKEISLTTLQGEWQGELVNKRKDGSEFPVYLSTSVIKDKESKVIGLIGVAKDITERKQVENALRESESRFKAIFDKSPIAIALLDTNGQVIISNLPLSNMVGYSNDELSVMKFTDFTYPDDAGKDMDLFIELIGGRISNYSMEKRFIHKNGNLVWGSLYVTVIPDDYGSSKGILGMVVDITERKQIEEKLQESEEQFRKLYENAKIGLYRTTPGGTILMANKALVNMLGFSSFEMLASRNLDSDGFGPKYERKEFLERFEKDGEVNNFESEWMLQDGNKILVQESAQAIRNSDDKILYFDGVIEDITERRRAEIELIEAKNTAEQSDRLKSAFLTNMSHEIRTPLNGILGFTSLLKEPKLSGVEQQEYIRIIEKSGERMLNIISDIISISVVESGNLKTSISATDMNKQIEFFYTFFKPEAMQKGLEINLTRLLSADESIILTDKEKVNTILSNLIKNAIKFTHKGSIEFGCEKKGRYLEYFVKDTGRGIAEEKKEIIFERFRQGSEANTRNYEGAGLGLSISKAYAEVLGGKIWVESDEGKGSIFYFTIPYKAAPDEKTVKNNAALSNMPEDEPRKLKILIAEDDESSEMLIRIIVRIFSDEIFEAATGVEAIEICRNNPDIDLILMDFKMPVMDGSEATMHIREFNKEVIIIAQSAYGLDGDKEKAFEAGCNDYITKPIDIPLLKRLIHKHFYTKE